MIKDVTGILLLLFALNAYSTFLCQTQKKIYIANDDHTDYLWSAGEADYEAAFLNMLDYYMKMADQTENEQPQYQSRWNCDGTFWLWTYQQNRSMAEFEKLMTRIKDGHISSPMNQLVLCLGGAPAEAVIRGMYYAGELERKYNMKFNMAVAMENQTLPYGLSSLWAGCGAKYSWKGVCNCVTKVTGLFDREREIYWLTGPDKSRVLMKWNSLFTDNESIGGYAEARVPSKVVDYVDESLVFKNKYKFNIIGAFGKGWDDLSTLTDEFIVTAKQKSNLSRQVIVSNMEDFFIDFEQIYKDSIPSFGAAYGNEWDAHCASLAEVSARVKRAVEKLRGAESLASVVSLVYPSFMNNKKVDSDRAWRNLGLYWEHNWCANGKVPWQVRNDWQRTIETGITSYVDELYEDASKTLGNLIEKSGTNQRFYAFNPLNWTRTDIADISFPDTQIVHVVDISTGIEVPSQIVFKADQRFLRVLAKDVPSVGYKVYEIRKGRGNYFSSSVLVKDNSVENDYYKLNVSGTGAILSLVDKINNREFARNIDGRYINDHGSGFGTVTVQNTGPVSTSVKCISADPFNHTSTITIFSDINRIDIINEVTENFDEILTTSFSFNINSPDVWHEEVGAVIRAKLLPEGGHYSSRNSRYEWLTLNHFADMSEPSGVGITLSNADCYFMKLGSSTPGHLDSQKPQISVLIGGQVDGKNIGIRQQGGDQYFRQRYAIQTHSSYDPVFAMKFSLEHQNPLITSFISGGKFLPGKSFSLLSINNPGVLLWSLKPSEESSNSGIACRLWNLENNEQNFDIYFNAGEIKNIQKASHIETPLSPANGNGKSISDHIGANQFLTYLAEYKLDSVPVELTNFSAQIIEDCISLTWTTATETNNYGFDVERRDNSIDAEWEKIGFVKGCGTCSSPVNYSFRDTNLQGPSKFRYRLKQIDLDGSYNYSYEVKVEIIPYKYSLYQNYPNPFNSRTTIKFSIAVSDIVKISVYNMLGEKVNEILNKYYEPGVYEIEFLADKLASGTYYYKIESGSFSQVKKMIILK